MSGGVFFRLGGAVVLSVAGAGGGIFDCASFIDRGLNVRSSVLYLEGAVEEALEEEGGAATRANGRPETRATLPP